MRPKQSLGLVSLTLALSTLFQSGFALGQEKFETNKTVIEGTATPSALKGTMNSLDERLAALELYFAQPGADAEITEAEIEESVHALQQLAATIDGLTGDATGNEAPQVAEQARINALMALDTDLKSLRQAAEAKDLEAIEAAFREIDLRQSCRACHQALGKDVTFQSELEKK